MSDQHEALGELEARLAREVTDLRRILEADLPAHVRRAARSTFERSRRADELSDEALKAFKAASEGLAETLPAEVLSPLQELEPWTWSGPEPIPSAPESLRDHPGLAKALDSVGERVAALLTEHGFNASEAGARAEYREPAYFVGGLYMKSVVANYWRALSDYDALKSELDETAGEDERAARRKRWEDA